MHFITPLPRTLFRIAHILMITRDSSNEFEREILRVPVKLLIIKMERTTAVKYSNAGPSCPIDSWEIPYWKEGVITHSSPNFHFTLLPQSL